MGENQNGSAELSTFINDLINSQNEKLGGMLLKTYDSDIFNNWVKTDYRDWETDRKSTRLNSSHSAKSRMPSSA